VHIRRNTTFPNHYTLYIPNVEQELRTLPEHLSSYPVLGGLHVARWGLIRSRKSKDRQQYSQMKKDKRTNNDLQNITQKT
jgi:2'-5' RNA ligase